MDASAVGRTLRWARKRAGMTQHELATTVGMPQPSIARLERGAVLPRTATLIAILETTGLQLTAEPLDPPADLAAIRRQQAMQIERRITLALGPAGKNPEKSPMWALRRLRYFNVPFVLIGDLAEVIHGSPLTMSEAVIEVCHATTDRAQARLAMTLDDLDPAIVAGLRLLIATPAGDTYDQLAGNALPLPIGAGIRVRVAAVEDLVRARRARGEADAAATLRAISRLAAERPTTDGG